MAKSFSLSLVLSLTPALGGGPANYAQYQMADNTSTSSDIEVDHQWTSIPAAWEGEGNAVFASMQFWFENGVGGYFGSQVWRQAANPQHWRNGSRQLLGTNVKVEETHAVVFSSWDKDAQHKVAWAGPNCERFGGEGVGSHCLIRFPFEANVAYTMRMATEDGRHWTGTIVNRKTGGVTTIGTLVFPDTPGYTGFGKLKQQGSAFHEYFKTTGCERQVVSAFGMSGPYFQDRAIMPVAATPDYRNDCNLSDVSACIMPGNLCGPPHVFFQAGGHVERIVPVTRQLWVEPYPGDEVSCGAHRSDACANCPQDSGAKWCGGDCTWTAGACSDFNQTSGTFAVVV